MTDEQSGTVTSKFDSSRGPRGLRATDAGDEERRWRHSSLPDIQTDGIEDDDYSSTGFYTGKTPMIVGAGHATGRAQVRGMEDQLKEKQLKSMLTNYN